MLLRAMAPSSSTSGCGSNQALNRSPRLPPPGGMMPPPPPPHSAGDKPSLPAAGAKKPTSLTSSATNTGDSSSASALSMAPPSQRHANDDLENGIRVPLLEVPKIEESHCCPCFWLPISCLTNVPKAVKNWLVARIGDMLLSQFLPALFYEIFG